MTPPDSGHQPSPAEMSALLLGQKYPMWSGLVYHLCEEHEQDLAEVTAWSEETDGVRGCRQRADALHAQLHGIPARLPMRGER